MSTYYYLIAGLPNISIEDGKPACTLLEFKEEWASALSDADRELLQLLYLKFDNQNLLGQLRRPDCEPDARGRVSRDELNDLIREIKEDDERPAKAKHPHIPAYFEPFIRTYLSAEENVLSWEDRLSALYYACAMQCENAFVAEWFELNLNINNLLAALTCRKYGLERADYVIGETDAAHQMRTSNARDFGLGDTLEYLPEALRIAEESDLFLREKKTDRFKWAWLEERTIFKTFTIESVLVYTLKLEIIERWAKLDGALGEKTFRRLIGAMKTGSDEALEEFKRNNKK
jgi:hypothetical protein